MIQSIAKLVCVTIVGALVACEKHMKENQDYPATQHAPADGSSGTPAPTNPPPQPSQTGSQQTVGTGTR